MDRIGKMKTIAQLIVAKVELTKLLAYQCGDPCFDFDKQTRWELEQQLLEIDNVLNELRA